MWGVEGGGVRAVESLDVKAVGVKAVGWAVGEKAPGADDAEGGFWGICRFSEGFMGVAEVTSGYLSESARRGMFDLRREPVAREMALEEFCRDRGLVLSDEVRSIVVPVVKEKYVLGGAQSGKSTVTALDVAVDVRLENPNRDYRYWIVVDSFTSDCSEIDYLYRWFAAGGVVSRYVKPRGGQWQLELFGGRILIETKTALDPEGLATYACDGVCLVEAGQMEGSIREHAITRIATRDGWLVCSGTLENDVAKPRYGWFAAVGGELLERPTEWARAWSLPSWANREAFPGGRQDAQILYWEQSMSPDRFSRYAAGVPAGVIDPIYRDVLENTDRGWVDDGKEDWVYSKGAGGHDFGEGWSAVSRKGHPSTLVAVMVTGRNVCVVRDVWEEMTGDTSLIESRRRLMSQRWRIPSRRWVFDPMQTEAAAYLGLKTAPSSRRRARVGMVDARLRNNQLLFDMVVQDEDGEEDRERKGRVRRLYEQMKRVHWVIRDVPGHDQVYDYARIDDDMVAALEDAIDLLDTKRALDVTAVLPSWKR